MEPPIPPAPLMIPDTAVALFSPRTGVTAPMTIPNARAPVPPPTRTPIASVRIHGLCETIVSRKPAANISAPMIRTNELFFLSARAPKKGCAKPENSWAMAMEKLTLAAAMPVYRSIAAESSP